MPVNSTLSLGDLLVDATQASCGPGRGGTGSGSTRSGIPRAFSLLVGRPGLGEHQPVGDRLTGVFVAPFAHHIGQVRNAGTEDVGQPRGLQRHLVGFRDHPGISDHGHVGELMCGLEGVDDRHHRGGLGLVALERRDVEREPGGVGEQAQGDLRVQTAFLRESRLAEPVTGIGLEVQCAHVIEHQAGRSQLGMCRARGRKRLPEFGFGEDRQPPLERPIGRRLHAGLAEHPQRIDLAGRLDDAGGHQIAEHLITIGGGVEAQDPVGPTQRLPQVLRTRRHDLQRRTLADPGRSSPRSRLC